MRVIVPLQGVVQGRGGLLMGSLVPCAFFYFLQLYLKNRHRHRHRHSRPSAASGRATAIAAPTTSPYYLGLDKVLQDPYDPLLNPDGIIQLGLSENRLCLDLVADWMSVNFNDAMLMRGNTANLDITGLATYQPFDGLIDFKLAMAGFMTNVVGKGVSFDPSRIVITSGATPAVEILCFCLADHGNAFLVPTPYYPGFDRDMTWRTGVELIPVHCRSTDNFVPSITALDQAFNQAKKRGLRVRGILISNPSNPVGHVLPRETLHSLVDFAHEKNIHIISDEIFAGSAHGNVEFVSMAEIVGEKELDMDRVHIVYGLSKDLSVPGFRVGCIYTFNETVLASSKRMARFSPVSAPTQKMMISLLSDTGFITSYFETNKRRVREVYDLFVAGLKDLGVKWTESTAGLYCWVDMSRLLSSYSEKGELELFDKLLSVAKINATPGSACHCIEPGSPGSLLRILYSTQALQLQGRTREKKISRGSYINVRREGICPTASHDIDGDISYTYTVSSVAAVGKATSSSASVATTNFIKSSCSTTRFPAVCVQSLSSYASAIQQNPKQLAQAALSASLTRAQAARGFVATSTRFKGLRAREYAAIKDCLEEMGDTVDRLSKSLAEMKEMQANGKGKGNGNEAEFLWHLSNVQTWVSAALTDENTCFDGYSSRTLNGRLKSSIRSRVLNVAQLTSNALSLVNRFASN